MKHLRDGRDCHGGAGDGDTGSNVEAGPAMDRLLEMQMRVPPLVWMEKAWIPPRLIEDALSRRRPAAPAGGDRGDEGQHCSVQVTLYLPIGSQPVTIVRPLVISVPLTAGPSLDEYLGHFKRFYEQPLAEDECKELASLQQRHQAEHASSDGDDVKVEARASVCRPVAPPSIRLGMPRAQAFLSPLVLFPLIKIQAGMPLVAYCECIDLALHSREVWPLWLQRLHPA
jgi:hypothetical protein